MTVETAVKIEGDKCGLDMVSSCEDRPPTSVGGGECNGDGKDDYVFVNGSDAASDDHVEAEGNEELNVSDFEGGGLNVGNGGDQLKGCNGCNGKLDNVVKVNGGGLKSENGVVVEEESGGKAEIELESESGVEDVEVVVGSSDAGNVDCQIDVKVKGKNSEIVEENGGDYKIKDGGSGVETREESDASVDGIADPSLDDDESGKQRKLQGVDSGVDVLENSTAVVVAEPLVPHVEIEDQLHLGESEDHGNQVDEPEKPKIGVVKPEVVDANVDPLITEANVDPLITEALVTNSEPVDSIAIESKPIEEDVKHESQENGITETQPRDNNLNAHDNEVEEFVRDDAVSEKQSQLHVVLPDDPRESGPVEAEAEVGEQRDSGTLGLCGNQYSNSVVTEALVSELEQSAESEFKDENASELTKESEECQEPQAVPESEGAENPSNLDLTTSEVDRPVRQNTDQSDEATVESTADVNGTPEISTADVNGTPEISMAENQNNLDSMTSEVDRLVQENTDQSDEATVEPTAEVNGAPDISTAENLSNLDMTTSEVDRPVQENTNQSDEATVESTAEVNGTPEISTEDVRSDNFDKSVVDQELDSTDEDGKTELPCQLRRSLESSVLDVSHQEHVAEQAALVDEIGQEAYSEDLTSEKAITVEEPTDLSEQAVVDVEGQDLDASYLGDGVSENDNHVSESAHDSGCLRSEDVDLPVPVGNEVDLSVTYDSDTRKGVTAEEGSCAGYNGVNSNADNSCSQSVVEASNNALKHCINGTNLEVKTVNGDVDAANKANRGFEDIPEPKISFGSFECVSPFSHIDNVHVQPNVLIRSTEFTTNQSDLVGNSETIVDTANGTTLQTPDANGVHSTDLDKTCSGVVSSEKFGTKEVSGLILEESRPDSSDGQNVNPDLVRRPFYYLIRIPRFDDVTLSEQIKLSEEEVQNKTKIRDDVRTEYQSRKATFWEIKANFEAAKSEERAAHRLLIAKRREIDSAQSLINLAKNAVTVEDVDKRILEMNRKLEHETHLLAVEKIMVREIKQLKSQRDQLAANSQRQQELQQALVQRVEKEEQLKVLRKELDALRDNHAKAEESFKAAKQKYGEESTLLDELRLKFRSADSVRQEAYSQLLTLKKQAYEKNKLFYNYKDAAKAANDLAGAGKKDSLEQHCVNQVEKIMELWNNNDEFRKEYIRCNQRSTLRRFRTVDGRSLGPDEEQPVLRNVSDNRVNAVAKVNSVATVLTSERDFPVIAKKAHEEQLKKVTEKKNKISIGKNKGETISQDSVAEPSGRIEIEEKEEEKEVPELTKEEEEFARKEEEKRRVEEAVRLKERRREEEKAKAQEALERKKKMAEKAQARAEFRAQKAAEEKEKEREKRAKKKEKKKGVVSEITEIKPAQLLESSPSETIREPEVSEKPVTVTKKSHKLALYTKQVKTTKSLSAPPAPLRNKGKRRIPQWVWWLVAAILSVILIFPLGNIDIVRGFMRYQ